MFTSNKDLCKYLCLAIDKTFSYTFLNIALKLNYLLSWGRRGRDRMVVGFTTMQSVPIITNVVSSSSVHGKVYRYSIQYYVIKFVSDLWQVSGYSVSSTNKTDRLDITEILLKVALNTITLIHFTFHMFLIG